MFVTLQVHLSHIRRRQSTWSTMGTRPVSPTWTVTLNPSSSCGEDARRAARRPSSSTPWAGSKVSSGSGVEKRSPLPVSEPVVLLLAVLRIWLRAAGGHDSLPARVARRPAGSRRRHPLSRSHPRVPQNGARLPDAPTCPDGTGRVHGKPHPAEKLRSPHCPVGVPGSRPSRNSVSLPRIVGSWRCSVTLNLLFLVCLTGDTSAAMKWGSCHCWPTWARCSPLTLDQSDLCTALYRSRYFTIIKLIKFLYCKMDLSNLCVFSRAGYKETTEVDMFLQLILFFFYLTLLFFFVSLQNYSGLTPHN